jgi:ParB-like nuclease domain
MSQHDTTTTTDGTTSEDLTEAGKAVTAPVASITQEAAGDPPWSSSGAVPSGLGSRLMIPVAALTAHPGNVRQDLALDAEFLASIADNGVLVPLRITLDTDDQGEATGYRVIDGHRRLAAALKAGHAEVPYDLVTDRQGDEAGQYLDMYNAHHNRKDLTVREEAGALFAAHQAGASKTRIRKATGLKAPQVKAALTAATLTDENHAALTDGGYDLTLEELAILAESRTTRRPSVNWRRSSGGRPRWSMLPSGCASSARNGPGTNGCAPSWRPAGSPSPKSCPRARSR